MDASGEVEGTHDGHLIAAPLLTESRDRGCHTTSFYAFV